MDEQLRLDLTALCEAAKAMRDAANILWCAHNPEDCVWLEQEILNLEEAQEAHSTAFERLERAEHYVRKQLEKEEHR